MDDVTPPVEPVVPVTQAVPEVPVTPQEETPEAKAERERNQRFSEVTRQKKEAEREAADARETARLALEALQQLKPPVSAPQEDKEPEPPKFTADPDAYAASMADYTKKLTAWTTKRALAEHTEAQQKKATDETQAQERARIESEYQENRAKAMAELPDFEEIAENPKLPVTMSMAVAMKYSGESAPKVLYHLGKNPAEAMRISRLPEQQQFMEIAMIRARLEAKPVDRPLPKPIRPAGAAPSTTKNIDEMPMDEYYALRKEQDRARVRH